MTYSEARDKILAPFYDYWKTTGYQAIWDDVVLDRPISEDVWARVSIKHMSANQASLGCGNDKRRYYRTGQLNIQIFAPVNDGNVRLYDIAQEVVNRYQAARFSDLWFRHISILEVRPDGAFQQMNVSAIFSYDDIR